MYKVYVRVDENNRIIEINSSEFIKDKDLEGWTRIDAGEGDKYHHAQGNYFKKSLFNENGIPVYKLTGGKAVERTAEEIQADIDAIPPPPPDPLMVTQKAAEELAAMQAARDAPTAEERLAAIEGVIDRLRDAMAGNALLRALVDKIWPDDAARKEGET